MKTIIMSDTVRKIGELIRGELPKEGALLPILHALQNEFGFIPPESVSLIAEALRISRADVEGVISFYSWFRREPAGRHVIQLCRAEACQARGCRALEEHARQTLGIDYHETTADGQHTLEPVYCLGNCAVGPNVLIDDQLVARVDAQRFDQLIASLQPDSTDMVQGP